MEAIYRWFWTLLPANPLLVRVVQGGSRRLRHLWVRMIYLGVLIAVVSFGLLFNGGFGGAVSLKSMASAGSDIFEVISYAQVILICLIAPLFMAGAIASEQAGQTYNILLTTPLSNLQIVLGSLLGRLFFVLALLLSGLPLFAVLLIFGGVPISAVFIAFAVAGLTALTVGSVAVALSVLRAGGRKAVFIFVITIVAYLVVAYMVDLAILRPLGGSKATTWLTPLHPLLVLESAQSTLSYQPPAWETLSGYPWLIKLYLARPFATFSLLSVLLSGSLMMLCAVVLRRIGQGESAWVTALRKVLRLPMPGVERTRNAREIWANPIAWREANTRGNGATAVALRWAFLVVAMLAAFVVLLLYHTNRLPSLGFGNAADTLRSLLLILLLVEVAITVMVAIYMSAGAVSREREDGTLDLLLTTPMTQKQYIWGKLRGLVSFLALLLAAPILTLAMASAYTVIGRMLQWPQARPAVRLSTGTGGNFLLVLPEAPVLLALMLVPFVALCVMIGMSWSLKAKGVVGAVVPSVAILGAFATVMGFCGYTAAENIPFLGAILNAFSPTTNLSMLVDPYSRVSNFTDNLVSARITMAVAAVLAAGGYSLIVYLTLLGMVKGFDHTVRKLSGTG